MTRSDFGHVLLALLILGGATAAEASSYSTAGTASGTGVTPLPPYVSGNWVSPLPLGPTQQQGLQVDKIYCAPAVWGAPVSIKALGNNVIGAGGTSLSLMYYADSANHRAGTLIAGIVVSSAATGPVSGAATATMAPGTRYWQCAWSNGGAPAILGQGNNGTFEGVLGIDSTTNGLANVSTGPSAGVNGYALPMTYSTTIPTDLSSQPVGNWVPLIGGTIRVPVMVQ